MAMEHVDKKDVPEVAWADHYFKKIVCSECNKERWSSWRKVTAEGLTPICQDCAQEIISLKEEEEETKVC